MKATYMKKWMMTITLMLCMAMSGQATAAPKVHTFEVGKSYFLLDGKPFVIKAAEIHYLRIPYQYYMLRLEAVSMLNGELLSTNTYFLWGNESAKELSALGMGKVDVRLLPGRDMHFVITNTDDTPALMLRLNHCGEDGEQVLPVEYSDNYFHLLPGERKTVSINWNPLDARGTEPRLKISGYNVKEFTPNL